MKKIAIIAALVLSGLVASAEIEPFAVSKGLNYLPYAAKALQVQASSTTLSGTVKLQSVAYSTTPSSVSRVETNVAFVVSYTNLPHQVAKINGRTVYDETPGDASFSYATNVVGDATNVIATLSVGTNAVYVATNATTYIKTSQVPKMRTVPVTNIATVAETVYVRTPVTNDICTITLSNGKGTNTLSNVFLLGGTYILGSGTAYEGGGATLILER